MTTSGNGAVAWNGGVAVARGHGEYGLLAQQHVLALLPGMAHWTVSRTKAEWVAVMESGCQALHDTLRLQLAHLPGHDLDGPVVRRGQEAVQGGTTLSVSVIVPTPTGRTLLTANVGGTAVLMGPVVHATAWPVTLIGQTLQEQANSVRGAVALLDIGPHPHRTLTADHSVIGDYDRLQGVVAADKLMCIYDDPTVINKYTCQPYTGQGGQGQDIVAVSPPGARDWTYTTRLRSIGDFYAHEQGMTCEPSCMFVDLDP